MNDTELFPALKTTFENPDAENGDIIESLFDQREKQHQDADNAAEAASANHEAQANMKEDVKQGAEETAGDTDSAQPKNDVPAGQAGGAGMSDLGSRAAGQGASSGAGEQVRNHCLQRSTSALHGPHLVKRSTHGPPSCIITTLVGWLLKASALERWSQTCCSATGRLLACPLALQSCLRHVDTPLQLAHAHAD